MDKNILNSIVSDVRACPDVILCTFGDGVYPDARHLMNALNENTLDLRLRFITTLHSPKYEQLLQNPHCCLYYFNPTNRHVVRLFGEIEFVSDMNERRAYWNDDYTEFGYTGPDDDKMVLMRFVANEYKFYIGNELKTGKISQL